MPRKKYPYYPSLLQAWGIFGLYLVFTIGVVLIANTIMTILDYQNESLLNFIAYTLSLGLLIWFARYKRLSYEKERPVFRFRRVPPGLYLIAVFTAISLNIVIEPLVNLIPLPEFMKELFMTLSTADIFTFLVVTVSAPLMEEMLFRGIILPGFLKIYSPMKAIIWSSVLFGFFHLNPWQFIPALFIGLVMGYIYWKTGSLLPCILVHWVMNTVSWYLGACIDQEAMTLLELLDDPGVYYVIYGISVPVLAGSIYLIRSILRSERVESSRDPS